MKQIFYGLVLCCSSYGFSQENQNKSGVLYSGGMNEIESGSVKNAAAIRAIASIGKYDSSYSWKLDTTNKVWKINSKLYVKYNASENIKSDYSKVMKFGEWQNNTQNAYTYNSGDKLTNRLLQQWDSGAWNNSWQYFYNYDVKSNLKGTNTQTWKNNAWENVEQVSYTFNVNNLTTNTVYQKWINGQWKNTKQYSYSYDANKNLKSSMVQTWNDSTWDNNLLLSYGYDLNNLRTSELTQYWGNGSWENSSNLNFTYDKNNKRISEFGQNWTNGSWVNAYQKSISYNVDNVSGELFQVWVDDNWKDLWRNVYVHDLQNKNCVSFTNKHFVSKSNAVVSGDSTYYFYKQSATSVFEKTMPANSELAFAVYPSPFSTSATIEFLNEQLNTRIVFSDMLGKEVMGISNFSGKKIVLERGDMKEGVYMITAIDKHNVRSAKMIVVSGL
jgi:hypothetical protein